MDSPQERTAGPLSPERARGLVIDLERRGLDTNRITVDASPSTTAATTGRTDQRSVARPAVRVAGGLFAGALIGLVLGLIVGSMLETATGAIVLATAIGAAIVGGLVGLYSRLPMNTEVSDVDSGVTSTVRVDVSGLPEDDVETVERLLATP